MTNLKKLHTIDEKRKEVFKNASLIEAKKESDTIRLWESYRDQALLWRALMLIQIPITLSVIIFSIVIWNSRLIKLNVPAKPLPGIYDAQEIPDNEFIDVATTFVNLLASYQPAVVRRQFDEGRKMLWEPFLATFDRDIADKELKTIESTGRTQLYFIDPGKTTIVREGPQIRVSVTGDRLKFIAGKELPLRRTKFTVTMSIVPRNTLNPYGIVITALGIEDVEM